MTFLIKESLFNGNGKCESQGANTESNCLGCFRGCFKY